MTITVKAENDPKYPLKPWAVLDGDLLYDHYSTEQEARAEAHKLIEEQRLHDAIEEGLEELMANLCGRFGLNYNVAKKHVKQVAEVL